MRGLSVVALAVAGAISSTANAAGDPDQGALLADTCMGCHGIPGYNNVYPTYRVPKLGGQNAAYLAASLKAYRSGDRAHPTMRAQAKLMTDQDIADLAAFFSQAPKR
ncbi:c-type cytochrome [Algiphilus sp.]|uniref:c-type cytochrome n=1 Tax=Algiphilus sp. TaxID=1872431 RepID=UPI001CA638BE|nr:c-type cytochrome [Algiphilus sp.]MBY8964657.1 c-type cytochrome [Algiphilus acroporae]MCI5063504.1 c-type cytochrome [Algiphilus sp.]MCI5103238.1 c-type cytochrome [Algiphilus sp.]MCR9091548.1 c-type cytochrome [Pseudomonadota bacterium]